MTYTKTRDSIAKRSFEISTSSSEVIAHRMGGMMLAGFNPSAAQKKEYKLMWSEKSDAMTESCQAMATQVVQNQQDMVASTLKTVLTPWWDMNLSVFMPKQYNTEALKVINKGLAPIHKKATSNAKRLKRE